MSIKLNIIKNHLYNLCVNDTIVLSNIMSPSIDNNKVYFHTFDDHFDNLLLKKDIPEYVSIKEYDVSSQIYNKYTLKLTKTEIGIILRNSDKEYYVVGDYKNIKQDGKNVIIGVGISETNYTKPLYIDMVSGSFLYKN
jgi:hypothetical protein